MDTKSPDQPGDYSPSLHENAEISTASAVVIESKGDSSQKAASKGATRPSLVQAIVQKDYMGVLIAIVVLVLVIGVIHPDFLAPSQLLDILNQATFTAILACGVAFLPAMREL